MFAKMSLSQKLYAGFAAVLLVTTGLGLFAWRQIVQIEGYSIRITQDCLPGVYSIGKVEAFLRRYMQEAGRGLLYDDQESRNHAVSKIEDTHRQIEEIFKTYEASITTEADRNFYNSLKAPRQVFEDVLMTKFVPALRDGKVKEAHETFRTEIEKKYGDYRDAVIALVDFNKKSGDDMAVTITAAVKNAVTGILICLAGAIAIGAAIGILLSRGISSSLNLVIESLSDGSHQVSQASNQVSEASQSLAEGANEQASSLEETSASLEEMASMTRQNNENAKEANHTATQTRQNVEKGRDAMKRMGDAISKIKTSSDQTAKIIKTIDEIAFQTNLLALNAAVEAARAGEAGKGFAVVAEEVRNLAQRSADAAKNTAALIEESQTNSENGVAVSEEVAGILNQIVESAAKLTHLVGEVANASEEQSKGIDQITNAVSQMDKVTQSNASTAEESASASEELFAQAKELKEMVLVLVGIVKGEGARMARMDLGHADETSHSRKTSPLTKSGAFASVGSKKKPDWTPAGTKKAVAVRKVETAIPFDEDDIKDF